MYGCGNLRFCSSSSLNLGLFGDPEKKKRPWGDDDSSVRNWGKDDLSGKKYFSFTFSFFLFVCGKMMTVIHLLHFIVFF